MIEAFLARIIFLWVPKLPFGFVVEQLQLFLQFLLTVAGAASLPHFQSLPQTAHDVEMNQ
jgi:hypothetical protein